jgi:hypothetical protein
MRWHDLHELSPSLAQLSHLLRLTRFLLINCNQSDSRFHHKNKRVGDESHRALKSAIAQGSRGPNRQAAARSFQFGRASAPIAPQLVRTMRGLVPSAFERDAQWVGVCPGSRIYWSQDRPNCQNVDAVKRCIYSERSHPATQKFAFLNATPAATNCI